MNQIKVFIIGFIALWCFLGLVNGNHASKKCEKQYAFSVDPYDSRHFYYCFDGQQHGFYCKVGEEFSMLDSTCVKYTTKTHIGKHPLESVGSCEKHGVYTVDPSDSKHAYYCSKGDLIEFYCKEGEEFSISDKTCVSYKDKQISENPFKSAGSCEFHNSYSVDSSDSSHFYLCWYGKKYGHYCKEGEKFSIPDSSCINNAGLKHIGRQPFLSVGKCEEDGVYSVDPSDSRHVYKCINGRKFDAYCKKGEEFSIAESTCVTKNKNPLKPIGSCSQEGYSVDPKNKRHFFNCNNGKLREFYCKEGEEFSISDSTCVTYTTEKHIRKIPFDVVGSCEKNYVYSLDPSDSRHFYYCLNQYKFQFYCENGDVFSISDAKCVINLRESEFNW